MNYATLLRDNANVFLRVLDSDADCASRAIKRIPRGPCSSRREANNETFRIKTFRFPTLAYNVS